MYKRLAKQLALYGVTTGFAVSSILSSSVSAISMDTGSMLYNNNNGVLFTNPNSAACTPSGDGDKEGDINDSSETAEAVFKFLTSTPFAMNDRKPLNAVQAAGFMGNFFAESAMNPNTIQRSRSGPQPYNESRAYNAKVGGYAFGLAQWDGGRRVALLNHASSDRKVAAEKWKDLKVQLDYLKKELNSYEGKGILQNADFAKTTNPQEAAVLVRMIFERAGKPHDTVRTKKAQDYYDTYKNLAPTPSVTTPDSVACDTGVSPGNGNIAETAKRLAWPERGHGLKNTDAYDKALKATGVDKLGDSCSKAGNSCDAFIATVMRLSGVDPGFPCCGADNQATKYMMVHKDKYEEISGTFSRGHEKEALNKLAPGDILWLDGTRNAYAHVKFYLGDGKEAGASHCKRTAETSNLTFDGSYRVFRAKSGVQSL